MMSMFHQLIQSIHCSMLNGQEIKITVEEDRDLKSSVMPAFGI